jgi:hypothetical protein
MVGATKPQGGCGEGIEGRNLGPEPGSTCRSLKILRVPLNYRYAACITRDSPLDQPDFLPS